MSAGDVATLAVLVFIGWCVWRGRKSGRAKRIANLNALHAAIEGARAEGRAEAAAMAAAVGNVVHVGAPNGDGGRAFRAEDIDLDDPRTTALLRAVLQRLDAVPTRDGRLNPHRVGELLGGVQHGPDAVDSDDLGVRADRAADGHVPDGVGSQVKLAAVHAESCSCSRCTRQGPQYSHPSAALLPGEIRNGAGVVTNGDTA